MEAELFIHFISSGPGRAAQLCLPNACAADSLPLARSTLDQGLLPFPSHLISMEWLGVGAPGGFILFNLCLMGRRVVLSPKTPRPFHHWGLPQRCCPSPAAPSAAPPRPSGVPEAHPGAGAGCQRAGARLPAGKLPPAEGGAALRSRRGAKGR